MLTKQQIFDKVAVHMLTQGRPALNDGTCVYLAPNGDTCAVGCLILPEHRSTAYENFSLNSLPNGEKFSALQDALRMSGVDLVEHNQLLRALQLVHDGEPAESWATVLYSLAGKFDLSRMALRIAQAKR